MDYEESGGKPVRVEGDDGCSLRRSGYRCITVLAGLMAAALMPIFLLTDIFYPQQPGKRTEHRLWRQETMSAVGVVYAHIRREPRMKAVTCLRVENCDEISQRHRSDRYQGTGDTGRMQKTPGDTETPGIRRHREIPNTGNRFVRRPGNDSADGNGNGGSVSGSVTVVGRTDDRCGDSLAANRAGIGQKR